MARYTISPIPANTASNKTIQNQIMGYRLSQGYTPFTMCTAARLAQGYNRLY